jgi:hypothetical protein
MRNTKTKQIPVTQYILTLLVEAKKRLHDEPGNYLAREAIPHYEALWHTKQDSTETISVLDESTPDCEHLSHMPYEADSLHGCMGVLP